MIREMICVACPLGCTINIELDDNGRVVSVSGNSCKRGIAYAESECTNPTRSLTTTVKVRGGEYPLVPVKSKGAIPKGKLIECVREISKLTVDAPVSIGDVILPNVLGTGIDIVATNNIAV